MFAHIDADAFFASVLARKDPTLKGKPVLALGMGGGFVIAASYEAKAKGVRTGMRLLEAKKICPEAKPVISDFPESCVVSEHIEQILKTHCPRVEKTSVDEWYLDLESCIGGTPGDLDAWARQIQEEIKKSVDVSVSVGIAPTKLLAKMASEYRKPSGITIVIPNRSNNLTMANCQLPAGKQVKSRRSKIKCQERAERACQLSIVNCQFLKDRPAAAIPGIGPRRAVHAESLNWKTAWDIANAPKDVIKRLFGKTGLEIQEELLGTPLFDVEEKPDPPKSISRCRSFRAVKDHDLIFGCMLQHLSYCVLKIRSYNLACLEVIVWIRNSQFHHLGYKRKLPQLMDTEEQILPYAKLCLKKIFEEDKAYTQTGIALCGLKPAGGTQYSLFEETTKSDKTEAAQRSLDVIRKRYGRDAILRGRGLKISKGGKKVKSRIPDLYGNIATVK